MKSGERKGHTVLVHTLLDGLSKASRCTVHLKNKLVVVV
jgi:hypothetical protein